MKTEQSIQDVLKKIAYKKNPTASLQLAKQLNGFLEGLHTNRRIVVVCLGTDRSTGDSLGPIAGSSLRKFRSSLFDLFGTLEEPVHAMNLDTTLEQIYSNTACLL